MPYSQFFLLLTPYPDNRLSEGSAQLLKAMIISNKANAQVHLHSEKSAAFLIPALRYVARQQGSVVAAAEIIARAASKKHSQDTSAALAAAEVLLALCSGPSSEAAQVLAAHDM